MYKISKSLNIFFSETAWPIFTRFYTEPPIEGVLRVSILSKGSALLNKITAMLIFGGKHLKIFFSRTKKALRLNLGTYHTGLKGIQVCSNYDPLVDILRAYLSMTRLNLRLYAFVWGKYWKFSFSKCIKDQWLKLTIYDQCSWHF